MSLRSVLEFLHDPLQLVPWHGVPIKASLPVIAFYVFLLITAPWWVPVILLMTILVHEYAHLIMAERLGYKGKQITIEPFGASLRLTEVPHTAHDEIWISLAGPAVNLAIAVILAPFAWFFYQSDTLYGAFLPVLAACVLNVAGAVLDMLPVYPLDGGRILRAWAIRKYGWERGSTITRNVGLGVSAAVCGIFWFNKRRFAAFMMLSTAVDCMRALKAQKWLREHERPIDRAEKWVRHQSRKENDE